MRRNDRVLGTVTLGLYLLDGTVSIIWPGPYLPPAWIYLLTGFPLVVFVAYRVVQGRTYKLGQNVALAVLLLSVFLTFTPLYRYARGNIFVRPPEYFLLTWLPVLGFFAVYLVRAQ